MDLPRIEVTTEKYLTLLETLRFVRQTVHQAHHDGTIEGCRKNTCDAVAQVLAKEGLS